MAYFALQVVSGREMVVKNAIQIAVHNQKRTDIKDIVVPSQIVFDLKNSSSQKNQSKTVIPFSSYVFVNVETDNDSFQIMMGELFQFLNYIPNVCKVLTQSIDNIEMEEMLRTWENLDLTQLVIFNIVPSQECNQEQKKLSMLTKTKEIIAKNKVISEFKRFVKTFGKKKMVSSLRYEENNNGFVVYSPLRLIMEALEETTMTLEEFMSAPHKLLHNLTKVCHAAYN